jgi:hypothetical protein
MTLAQPLGERHRSPHGRAALHNQVASETRGPEPGGPGDVLAPQTPLFGDDQAAPRRRLTLGFLIRTKPVRAYSWCASLFFRQKPRRAVESLA